MKFRTHSLLISAVLLGSILIAPIHLRADESRTAVSLWYELVESTLLGVEVEAKVDGTHGKVTYGAEKEGSSSLITRVMGPNAASFREYVVTKLSAEDRTSFLREFLRGWATGLYREKEVRDLSGVQKAVLVPGMTSKSVLAASPEQLLSFFDAWLTQAGDRSFSFITKRARQKIYNGDLLATRITPMQKAGGWPTWVPLYGLPEKYIEKCSKMFEMQGWEINFAPQPTFADFEKMIVWFKETLKNTGQLFEAPGHQRLVYPKWENLPPAELADSEARLAEMYKGVQAYIVLKGAAGLSGMEKSLHIDKQVHPDSSLARLEAWKGVIRLENDRFGENTRGVEIRAGTKTDSTRRFVEQVITARYATRDFSGLAKVGDWTLVDLTKLEAISNDPSLLMARFGVTLAEATAAVQKLKAAKVEKFRNYDRVINREYWIPFWNWEGAPYVGAEKAAYLKELTAAFIRSVAAWTEPRYEDFQVAFQTWARASNLTKDLEKYLQPAHAPVRGAELETLLTFRPSRPGAFDVNQIDLGMEYTARFPVKVQGAYTDEKLADGRGGWLATEFDLTDDERAKLIESYALTLARKLNGGAFTPVSVVSNGGHGHSMVVAYELKDSLGRKWRVEWDGINRTYDQDSQLIQGSPRGGHMEVVTPKFKPSAADVQAVFEAFEEHHMIPSTSGGGGHINVDLAPFEGNPRAFARFLSVFLRYRGILALMFQDIRRQRSAEAVPISDRLASELADFNGSEARLKVLLYNERFFNTRVGRKSRYTQIDVSAYFQDVIPAEFVTQDFDLFNDLWRPQFRVNPNIRKAEFRMFDAPLNERIAALQKNATRALLHFAINGNGPLDGRVQAVNYEGYVANPAQAKSDFAEVTRVLELDPEVYRPLLLTGLATAREIVANPRPTLPENKSLPEIWGKASWHRLPMFALSSEGRLWSGEAHPAAIEFKRLKTLARAQADRERARFSGQLTETQVPPGMILRQHCAAALQPKEGQGIGEPSAPGEWNAYEAYLEYMQWGAAGF